jgi:tRNA 2-thiouridine synthesizing protein A
MTEVDARGRSCPIPVVKAKRAMDGDPSAVVCVLVDEEVARENVSRLATSAGYAVDVEPAGDGYRLVLTPRPQPGDGEA